MERDEPLSIYEGEQPDEVRQLGPYRVERLIAVGGMAQVYEAQRLGPHGFTKRVAIKRILPEYLHHKSFVTMFIDEARLAARLEHPNIVQVFDFGEADGEFYIAMEMVDGTHVNALLRTLAARGEAVPLEAALHLVSQASRALAYAHQLCDEEGKPLGVVHRDVSPANLLLTRTGHLKLSDFGIARAEFREQKTESGQLRGKLGYMSPEQVMGRPLDDRSDVFTLSIIFAEMLMGETLFARGSDLDILLRIRDADLTTLVRNKRRFPNDVRQLLLLGLSRDPRQRPDARAFGDALDTIIRKRNLRVDGPALAAQLLYRLELCPPLPNEAADGPVARPTALISLDYAGDSPTAVQPDHLLDRLGSAGKALYHLREENGRERGPLTFPEVVGMVATGAVDGRVLIRKDQGAWTRVRDFGELGRFFSTPALQWRAEEVSRPQLRGELRSGILIPLIHSLSCHRETGVLYLDAGTRKKKLYFVDGRPEFIASTDVSDMLGQHLIKGGRCLPMEVNMALAVLPHHRGRLGDALVNLGIMRPVELFREVTTQVRHRYLDAFRWRQGSWSYVRDARSHEEAYPFEQNPYVLMRDAMCELHPSELEAALAPVWEKVVLTDPSPPAPLPTYQLSDPWESVIREATGNHTVGSIFAKACSQGKVDPEDAMRALFLGISCQLIRAA